MIIWINFLPIGEIFFKTWTICKCTYFLFPNCQKVYKSSVYCVKVGHDKSNSIFSVAYIYIYNNFQYLDNIKSSWHRDLWEMFNSKLFNHKVPINQISPCFEVPNIQISLHLGVFDNFFNGPRPWWEGGLLRTCRGLPNGVKFGCWGLWKGVSFGCLNFFLQFPTNPNANWSYCKIIENYDTFPLLSTWKRKLQVFVFFFANSFLDSMLI